MKLRALSFAVALAAPIALACAESRGADPTTVDCLGASESSLKLGSQHKLRAARSQLLVCAAATCPTDIRKECLSRVDEVNAQIPTIVFSAKDGKGADLTAVKVTMDGEVLTEHIEGTAMSIDPGPHVFTFEIPGRAVVTKNLVIVEGQKDRRELVSFADDLAPVAPVAAPPGTATAASGESPSPSGIATKRIVGFVVGGVGLAGVGVGATLLALASSLGHRSQQEYANNRSAADSDHQAAVSDQTAAFVIGATGIAALGVGVFLILGSHGSQSSNAAAVTAIWVSPTLGAGSGGMSLGGSF